MAVREIPFTITPTLAAKLSSVLIHAEEGFGPHGHPLDMEAIKALLKDPEVIEWLGRMKALALVPLKRR